MIVIIGILAFLGWIIALGLYRPVIAIIGKIFNSIGLLLEEIFYPDDKEKK